MNNYKPHPAQQRFFDMPDDPRWTLFGGGRPPVARGTLTFANGSTITFGASDGEEYRGQSFAYLEIDGEEVK